MTDHLPECPWAPHDCDEDMCERCDRGCYCNELRACEQRMDDRWEKFSHDQFDAGYAAGVDAAREAVAALDAYYAIEECQGNPLEKGDPEDPDPWKQGHLIERDEALAAINALRGES